MTWFDSARFGMFIHWGHSSQQGVELSWPMVGGNAALPESDMTVAAYQSSAATFNPGHWDPAALARTAKALGMQYAVFTTKHHDGYAMFHTKTSDFGVEHSPFGRDIVREFVDAFRAEGLRIGLYFSLIDWRHADYPAFIDEDKPYRFGRSRPPTPEQWERFLADMFEQVRELLTNYGKIDVIWFDGGWERAPEQWKAVELEALIRGLQPEILINDRLPTVGDFETPEQFVPAQAPTRTWETCMTLNESWGYNPSDTAWKSPRQVVHTLCEVAGRGGNLLLNVSPMGDGSIMPEQRAILGAMQRWLSGNGESIVGTEPGLEPWQFYGPSSKRGNTTYLHLLMRPYESVTVRGVPIKRVKRVTVLASGQELTFTTRCSIVDSWFNRDPKGEVTIALPEDAIDSLATVLALEMS
ncbi:MAG: alpha-L-fucosidase [Dehalococcoidia bacterium]|nr:alpha-L-fucosidase [Dehalococcoidia bacterium]